MTHNDTYSDSQSSSSNTEGGVTTTTTTYKRTYIRTTINYLPEYPSVLPPGWTNVYNEEFGDLTDWINFDLLVWSTQCLPANVNLISGGVEITGNYEEGVTNEGGMLETYTSYGYGYFECRCKVPAGQGLWPAFWLYGADEDPDHPEIDIFETIGNGNVYFNNWLGGSHDQHIYASDVSDEYHVFSALWENGSVTYYLDGVQRAVSTSYVPSTPLYIVVDLFIGGAFPGDPVGVTFPVYFDIDYVRVWQDI